MSQPQIFSKEYGKITVEVLSRVAQSKMSAADRQKLSDLVGIQVADDFYFQKKQVCPSCQKELSFYDVVKTAIDQGIHDKAFFQNLFAGNQFIVRSEAEDKQITCSKCSAVTMLDGFYTCMVYLMG